MKITSLLLCQNVTFDPITLTGVQDTWRGDVNKPYSMAVFMAFRLETEDYGFTRSITCRVIDSDGQQVGQISEPQTIQIADLPSTPDAQGYICMPIREAALPRYGQYRVEVYIDEVFAQDTPMHYLHTPMTMTRTTTNTSAIHHLSFYGRTRSLITPLAVSYISLTCSSL